MKAYTDIEQSKKLAEILPIESADMWWSKNFLYYNPTACVGISSDYTNVYTYKWGDDDIPCWSLAALLDFLAKQDCFPEITYTGTCYLMDINFYDDEEGKAIHPIHFIRTEGNTLIDACVEMIYELKERDLL